MENRLKRFLLEPGNEEELKLIEAFIKQHQIKSFTVEDSTADANDIFNDVARLLIPFVR